MSAREQAATIIRDPTQFIPRLQIIDRWGSRQPFGTPFPEQIELLRAFMAAPQVFVLKARQIGCGTIRQAYDFHYVTASLDPVSVLVAAHEDDAKVRHAERYQQFYDALPGPLQRPIAKRNTEEFFFKTKDGLTSGGFKCVTAGGKGGGRSFTYQRAHFTELAFWGAEAQRTYASLTAPLHGGPHYSLCIESTSNGPGNFFAHMAEVAQRDPMWVFLFFPWSMNPHYRIKAPPGLERGLTEEEHRLMTRSTRAYVLPSERYPTGEMELPPLDIDQIAWRRSKVEAAGLSAFRYEYPLTVEEAFASGGESFLPDEALTSMLFSSVKPEGAKAVYESYQPMKRYVIGGDIGNGLGKDHSALCILDQNGDQVAMWADNRTPPHLVGELCCELAAMYGNALVLLEANGPGRQAILRMGQLGYKNLWKDEKGRDYTTWGNQMSAATSKGKHELFGHARRRLLERPPPMIRDRLTIQELLNIREDERGRIGGADKKHDDRAMAWVLAQWAQQRIATFQVDRVQAVINRFGLTGGRVRRTNPF